MLKHVVLIRFKPGVSEDEIAEMKRSLAGLPALIPEIREYDFGADSREERAFDFCLVSAFEDREALQRYMVEPRHAAVGKYVRSLCEEFRAVDFEY